MVFCFLGLIGWFTRTASFSAALSGVYILGLPQCYGKVDHIYHHMVWFMLLLGTSRCADVLSVDAVWKAFREADRGRIVENGKSAEYGRPLRFIWMLMGIIYFFPGLWKLLSGWRWVFSDNLRNRLYDKWYEMGGWVPVFRIDQTPWLCQLSALATVFFELSFVVLILFPLARPMAALGGLLFHNLTYTFMKIGFFPLQVCYLSFVNWAGLSARTGRRFFKKPLILLYDGNCKLCRRTISAIRQFDVFQRVFYVNAMDGKPAMPPGSPSIDPDDLMRDMHAVVGGKKWRGYEAYRVLAQRIPVFWPLWPFLWLWPVPPIGRWVYRKVADSRLCLLKTPPVSGGPPERGSSLRLLNWIGIILLSFNFAFGISKREAAWPFVCYPAFSGLMEKPEKTKLMVCAFDGFKEEEIDLIRCLGQDMNPNKIYGVTRVILKSPAGDQRNDRLRTLVRMMREKGADFGKASTIRFYEAIYSVEPGKMDQAYLSRKLLAELAIPADNRGELNP